MVSLFVHWDKIFLLTLAAHIHLDKLFFFDINNSTTILFCLIYLWHPVFLNNLDTLILGGSVTTKSWILLSVIFSIFLIVECNSFSYMVLWKSLDWFLPYYFVFSTFFVLGCSFIFFSPFLPCVRSLHSALHWFGIYNSSFRGYT